MTNILKSKEFYSITWQKNKLLKFLNWLILPDIEATLCKEQLWLTQFVGLLNHLLTPSNIFNWPLRTRFWNLRNAKEIKNAWTIYISNVTLFSVFPTIFLHVYSNIEFTWKLTYIYFSLQFAVNCLKNVLRLYKEGEMMKYFENCCI